MTLLILVTLPAAVTIWLMQAQLTAVVVHFLHDPHAIIVSGKDM